MVYKLTISILKIIFSILFRINVKGLENIPKNSSGILVSNHNSLLDAPILAVTANRKLSAFAKKNVFNSKSKEWFLEKMGGILVQTNNINRELITKTKSVFDNSLMLLIFPEGKIEKEIGDFNDGFLRIAQHFKVPIIPVTITSTYNYLRKDQKIPCSGKIEVFYGTPITSHYNINKSNKFEMNEFVNNIKNCIVNNMKNSNLR